MMTFSRGPLMNPFSIFTYYRRHKRQTLMLVGLIALSVTGLYLVFSLLQETYITPLFTINRYLSRFSLVQAEPGTTLDPAVITQINASPDVAQVLPQYNVEIAIPSGVDTLFRLIGLRDADMTAVLAQCGVRIVEGHLPEPGTNGLALSREIATVLHLKIGDTLQRTENETGLINLASPLELVGILSGDVRLGIMSYQYLHDNDGYDSIARQGVLVIPHPGRDEVVDAFLRQVIRGSRAEAITYQLLKEDLARSLAVLYKIGVPLVLLVTAAITLVIGTINRLVFMRRLPEFGILHAVGRSRGWIARRLTMETTGLALTGSVVGVLLAWGVMAILNTVFYAPKGYAYNPFNIIAFPFVAPIPLAAIGFSLFTASHALRRMDAVAIVERGELSLEGERTKRAMRMQTNRLPRPLASTTYYRRHPGQAAVLVGATALMVVGASIFVFGLEAFDDARQPLLNYLKWVSLVSPNGELLDAATIEQIRANPAVDRAIPVAVFSPMGIYIPPTAPSYPVDAYAVTAEDMVYLQELFKLELAEGYLPRPGTNGIAIPSTFAKNRNLHVGDVIGDRDHPIHPEAPTLPSGLIVTGVFSPAKKYSQEIWIAFTSLEYLEMNQEKWKIAPSLLVVPRAGQKASLDAWLERTFVGEKRLVFTLGNQRSLFKKQASTLLFSLSLVESIIAVIAALALTGLYYVFASQRQAEYGVLNALGLGRLQAILRSTRETLFTTGVAWGVAILVGAAILIGMQYGVFFPSGVEFNLFNPLPWFYTLPVPVAVLVVNAGLVAWSLSHLDPVMIIERR
jgi:ABC-type lipoprotein release transport system permease subunit